jgi:hypothetical protein
MDLTTFLDRHGMSRAEVTEAIHRRIGRERGEILFLAGSLIEGLGNARSDLDAVLISDRRPGGVGAGVPIPIWTDPFALDVEWWPRADVEALLGRLAELPVDRERDPRTAEIFGGGELRLLHRLGHGEPVQSEAETAELQARLDPRTLDRVLVDRGALEVDAQQTDVVGFVGAGDLESALLQAIEMVGHAAGTLLAAVGDANPSRKWRLAKLRGLGRPGPDLPGGPLLPSPADAFLRLWTVRSTSPAAVRRHLAECVHTVRRVVPWARQRFLAAEPGAARERALPGEPAGTASRRGRILPCLDLDLRVRWLDGRLEVTRPGWPEPWVIDERTHEALICFDGRTRLDEAVRRLRERTGADLETARATLHDLARRLVR